jgi:Ca-activated chloride channel family protein
MLSRRSMGFGGVMLAALLAGCGGGYGGTAVDAANYRSDVVSPYPAPQPMASTAAEPPGLNTEAYKDYGVNPTVDPLKDRLSTFSIDVDTASYSISRLKLNEGELPPVAAVRAEEFLNSFDYAYENPEKGTFGVYMAAAPSPFEKGHHLVRIGLQTKRISIGERKSVHLVYLVDTSGSMSDPGKLDLAKKSLKILTESLKKGDTIALCTYAGSVREILAPTGIDKRDQILSAIDGLDASGSTAMSSGIDLAYKLASDSAVKGDVNRVIVLSDGDANVGPSSHEQILDQIASYKDKGIQLSTVGFGQGNYKDTMMEQLADKGDGNYSYIDSTEQAQRVFSEEVNGLLETVAKDVKIQVEWDPAAVTSYRLIGYENRDIADKDFRNDKVDAGEVGAGHSVTALYDVVFKDTSKSPLVVRLRAKAPDAKTADAAVETAFKMAPSDIAPTFEKAPKNFQFAVAVAEFAEVLRQSPAAKGVSLEQVERVASEASDGGRDDKELVELVAKAIKLSPHPVASVAQ